MVKLATQDRQAQIEAVPPASALSIEALREPLRDRKKQKNPPLSTVEIPLLMRLSALPDRCGTSL